MTRDLLTVGELRGRVSGQGRFLRQVCQKPVPVLQRRPVVLLLALLQIGGKGKLAPGRQRQFFRILPGESFCAIILMAICVA